MQSMQSTHRHHATSLSTSPDTAATANDDLVQLAKDSPFLDLDHPITLMEGCKMVFMFPIALWRCFGMIWATAMAYCGLPIVLYGHKEGCPLHPFRSSLLRAWIRLWASLGLMISGFYTIPVRGWSNYSLGRVLRAPIVFNHESYVDPLVLVALFAPSGIAKSGTAEIPLIGRIARALEFLFVSRKGIGDPSNAYALASGVDICEIIKERSKDSRYPPFMIAPEATTKSKPCLLKFRQGVFKTGLPVLPVLLKYKCRNFNPGWGLEFSTFLHIWRLLSQFANFIEVEILPPYVPSEEEQADPSLYAENVRELMARHLGVPCVDQGIRNMTQIVNEYQIRPGPLGRKLIPIL